MQREPAKKVRIVDLIAGIFKRGDKETKSPNYLITPLGQRVSRVNLLATVTQKFLNEFGDYGYLVLDDGTEAIRVRFFKEQTKEMEGVEEGDLVVVIGKVKEFDGEIYVSGEAVRKVEDFNLEIFRRAEILKEIKRRKKLIREFLSGKKSKEELVEAGIDEEFLKSFEAEKKEVDYEALVLRLLRELDTGKGVEIGKLFEISELPSNLLERVIDDLLRKGEIYEPYPGILKRK